MHHNILSSLFLCKVAYKFHIMPDSRPIHSLAGLVKTKSQLLFNVKDASGPNVETEISVFCFEGSLTNT